MLVPPITEYCRFNANEESEGEIGASSFIRWAAAVSFIAEEQRRKR